jgi:double-stranded uracil-DNA glycosylase
VVGTVDHLRLRDVIEPRTRLLLVGINPGIRSATIGHHFAGYSNRFWKLLFESRLVTEPLTAEDDARLPEWGLGITNLIGRATPGVSTLRPDEYVTGLRTLRRKVRRVRPEIVAFIGVSLYRTIAGVKGPIALGLPEASFEGARVVVLPNPSGRNAHFSYREMLVAFRVLKRIAGSSSVRTAGATPSASRSAPERE